MTMLVAWVVYPLVLAALCGGLGLLVDRLVDRRLPGALILPVGLAAMIVAGGFTTATDATAEATVPLLVLLALVGLGVSLPFRFKRPDRGAIGVAVAVFLVFGAPVILSGKPTFAGYIALDDTATWLAMTDRLMEHGRSLSGLEVSTYRRTLEVNIPAGYPVGSFLPLGVGAKLTGSDPAWLVQPYMATMAAFLVPCLYWLVAPLVAQNRLRALVVFGAAQPALLYGYSLWGGVKEMAVALGIATFAALSTLPVRSGTSWRDTVPAGVAAAALLGVVGWGGLAWIAPILALVGVWLWRTRGPRRLRALAWRFLAFLALLAVPTILAGGFSPTQEGLTDAGELGNLVEPLHLAQIAGIWPAGDFRLDPVSVGLTAYLVALAVLSAAFAVVIGWRSRTWTPLLYGVGATIGSIGVLLYASPWVGAKALASASPAVLLLSLAGVAAFALRADRVIGAALMIFLLGGVLWSNALAYHDVSLAPYDQLRELEEIGEEFAGEGPALLTEYQPYGARHFLRELDAEAASELRYRPVTLVDGTTLERGEWADTDRISSPALLAYRTLVLRHSPVQSRPPSAYSLVGRGDYYDVWQRQPGGGAEIVEHLPLGDEADPGAVPACAEVMRIAAAAGPDGTVAAVRRGPNATAALAAADRPADWVGTESNRPEVSPGSAGSAPLRITLPRTGLYDLYLLGGARNRISLTVDGTETGAATVQRNEDGQYLSLGRATLGTGSHLARLTYSGPSLAPGSGGPAYPIGPLVASPASAGDPPVLRVPAGRAGLLCGQRLDWLEALRPSA